MESLIEFNDRKRRQYKPPSEPRLNGIACPECGAELMDSSPARLLPSIPPKKDIHCPECDYVGFRVA